MKAIKGLHRDYTLRERLRECATGATRRPLSTSSARNWSHRRATERKLGYALRVRWALMLTLMVVGCGSPGAQLTMKAAPDPVGPDSAAPDPVGPDSVEPDSVEPDSAAPSVTVRDVPLFREDVSSIVAAVVKAHPKATSITLEAHCIRRVGGGCDWVDQLVLRSPGRTLKARVRRPGVPVAWLDAVPRLAKPRSRVLMRFLGAIPPSTKGLALLGVNIYDRDGRPPDSRASRAGQSGMGMLLGPKKPDDPDKDTRAKATREADRRLAQCAGGNIVHFAVVTLRKDGKTVRCDAHTGKKTNTCICDALGGRFFERGRGDRRAVVLLESRSR